MATDKLLCVKKETTYATDAAPTPAANARLTRNLQIKPIVTDRLDRNLDRQIRGRVKDIVSNKRQTISYELEVAGSGAAGTAPPWMEDLECCGMLAPVLVATTSATQKFALSSTAMSSGSFYAWDTAQRTQGVGGRGTFGWDFTANAIPFFKVDVTTIPQAGTAIVDNTPAAATFTAWKDPLEVNTVNTDFFLDGFAAVLKQFTGDVGADVKARNLVGANYIRRGNHAITGTIVVEAPLLASKNYFATLDSGAEIAVQLIHGIAAGSIVELASTRLQITDISRQEEDDVLMLSITYALNAGTTNDDLTIIAR